MTKVEANVIVDKLLKQEKYKAIFESLKKGKCSDYICYSAGEMKIECTAFASNRGGRNLSKTRIIIPKPPNLIIKWSDKSAHLRTKYPDPKIISNNQFFDIDILDAGYEILFQSSLKFNARIVEDTYQSKFMQLDEGIRLWRQPDAGVRFDKKLDGKLHQVAIMFSGKIPGMIKDGTIDVFYSQPKIIIK